MTIEELVIKKVSEALKPYEGMRITPDTRLRLKEEAQRIADYFCSGIVVNVAQGPTSCIFSVTFGFDPKRVS